MSHGVVRLALFVALVVSLGGALSASVSAEEEVQSYIVVLKDEVEDPAEVAAEQTVLAETEPDSVYELIFKGYAAELSEGGVEEIEEDPRVVAVEPNVVGGIAAQTVPTGINRIFALSNPALLINETDEKRADVDVAVLDTGIDQTHPDLNVVARADCSNGPCVTGSGTDGHSHGTHVAGTIAAIDNGSGVVGVAAGARLWSVKVVDNGGFGTFEEYLNGMEWIRVRAGQIEVVNSSLRYPISFSEGFERAMKSFLSAGLVHVAAAGNENEKVKYLPGVYTDVITVSAIADYDGQPGSKASPTCYSTLDDRRAGFSNYGPTVDVTAPGVCILSTTPGNQVGTKSGTSMASPHVAGAAAVLASQSNPNSEAAVKAIEKAIEEEGNYGWIDTSGDGIQEPLLDVGDSGVFALGGKAPTVETGGFTNLQSSSVVLRGFVNPGELPTTFQFEYGTSTAYGSKAPVSPKSAGSGSTNLEVSETVTNLTPRTTYHYRLVATNARGTAYGKDVTFTTPRRYVPRFEADSYPASLAGSQVSGNPLKFILGSQISCGAVSLTKQLTAGARLLTISAKHTGCTQGESTATVDMKSCSYVFGVANSGPPYTGSLGISCATPGDAIEIVTPSCVIKLAPQTIAGAVSYSVEGTGSGRFVRAAVSTKALTYKRTSGICIFLGAEASNGELSGAVEYAATNGKSESIALYVTGEPSAGLFITGEKSAESLKQPRFEAGTYPAALIGEERPSKFTFGSMSIDCVGAELDSQLSNATSLLTISAKHTGCTQGESTATVDMKSCSYVFGVANSGPPYTGSLGISCATPGDAIEIVTPSCVIKLAPQTIAGAVSYSVEGTGSGRFVRAAVSTKALTYKRTSGICIFLGAEASNGELSGTVELYGFG